MLTTMASWYDIEGGNGINCDITMDGDTSTSS